MGDPHELSEHLVDPLQGAEALRTDHPGVVGDLVVIHVVDVDAAHPRIIDCTTSEVFRSRNSTLVIPRRKMNDPPR